MSHPSIPPPTLAGSSYIINAALTAPPHLAPHPGGQPPRYISPVEENPPHRPFTSTGLPLPLSPAARSFHPRQRCTQQPEPGMPEPTTSRQGLNRLWNRKYWGNVENAKMVSSAKTRRPMQWPPKHGALKGIMHTGKRKTCTRRQATSQNSSQKKLWEGACSQRPLPSASTAMHHQMAMMGMAKDTMALHVEGSRAHTIGIHTPEPGPRNRAKHREITHCPLPASTCTTAGRLTYSHRAHLPACGAWRHVAVGQVVSYKQHT